MSSISTKLPINLTTLITLNLGELGLSLKTLRRRLIQEKLNGMIAYQIRLKIWVWQNLGVGIKKKPLVPMVKNQEHEKRG